MAHCSAPVAEGPVDRTLGAVDQTDDGRHKGSEGAQASVDTANDEDGGDDDHAAAAADEGHGLDTALPRSQECHWQTGKKEVAAASSRAYSLPEHRHLGENRPWREIRRRRPGRRCSWRHHSCRWFGRGCL